MFAPFGSNVEALTVTVLLILLPVAVTFTTSDDVSVAFTFSVETVQLNTPVEPFEMGAQVHGPGETLKKYVPFGMGSFSTNCLA